MPTNQDHNTRPKKLQRISQACDLCHRRSIRCRPSVENPQSKCQNCYDFAVNCTYKRPSRRRRNPSAGGAPPNLLPTQQQHHASLNNASFPGSFVPPDYTGAYMTVREGKSTDLLGIAWRSFAAASRRTIDQYMEIYMDVVYPIFPLFHGPKLWDRLRKRQHLTDRGFFASVMAACALAAARARDGVIGGKYQFEETLENSPEIFFSAAQDAISKDLTKSTGIDFLRACALLALTSMQYGQIASMHQYFGHYTTLSATQSFHDEDKWPSNLSQQEVEERRRLFWSMYCFDVYLSVVFNTMVKTQETHSNVCYPSESSDEEISAGMASTSDSNNWLRGWNFTTDLYRVLEHTIKRIRGNRQRREDRISIVRMMISDTIPDLQIMENVIDLYYQLPPRFNDFKAPVVGDRSQDIFGFQAANIQATLQLVRITLFESHNRHNVLQKCDVAEQVLTTFQSIAPHYLRAISTPLIYHLGGIGQILAQVMQGVLTEDSYQRVRSLLGSMADLLEELESGLSPTAGASTGLRYQIDRIDQYMNAQREMLASTMHHPHSQAHASNGMTASMICSGQMPNGSQLPINSLGMRTPLGEFQLPADLTGDWPWPFEFASQDANGQLLSGFEENNHY
ncbi:uncharacterized protein MYCFIDRAFT_30129 [Pseudocercospora fijiensis CIRAD86]|uniref:Zn(2)-C6 fungal-type domain-containing protein n=1 Tax=Pseudocercospora fijiensis (strain CIRAD86) TaxID=383855 RepID=M2ZA51_PSEFD|nr:uncharacterized protein MYCFIDRAFT_30129 [Pseudocercospora fijiensis CIRAD86]EME86715.1 hypothetical protein MYCFIDRAFT_30129 [Pseudocercospora fijiensis CIRAD86]